MSWRVKIRYFGSATWMVDHLRRGLSGFSVRVFGGCAGEGLSPHREQRPPLARATLYDDETVTLVWQIGSLGGCVWLGAASTSRGAEGAGHIPPAPAPPQAWIISRKAARR